MTDDNGSPLPPDTRSCPVCERCGVLRSSGTPCCACGWIDVPIEYTCDPMSEEALRNFADELSGWRMDCLDRYSDDRHPEPLASAEAAFYDVVGVLWRGRTGTPWRGWRTFGEWPGVPSDVDWIRWIRWVRDRHSDLEKAVTAEAHSCGEDSRKARR